MWGGLGKYRGREAAERAAESECAKRRPAPVRAVRERGIVRAKEEKNKGGRAAKKRLAGEEAGRPTTTTTKEEVSGI